MRLPLVALGSLLLVVAAAGCASGPDDAGDPAFGPTTSHGGGDATGDGAGGGGSGSGSTAPLTPDGADAPHLLALGDSITFAWNPLVESDVDKVRPANYSGYAELLGSERGWTVDNAACPGEASGSFVDESADDNGCDANRAAYGLHHDWDDKPTQLAFVEDYLEQAMSAGKPPALITLTLGGNDLLLMQKSCDLGLLSAPCELAKLPFYAHGYQDNLGKILSTIEASGYQGDVVFLTTYAPDYSDGVATLGLKDFNGKMVDAVQAFTAAHSDLHVVVADAYAAFEKEASEYGGKTCATGLLIKKPDGSCDIHPTAAGHRALATAVTTALGN